MIKLFRQIIGFGIVGIICFIIDYMTMILLTEVLDIHYLLSSSISFAVSTVVNYLLSMRYIFHSKENSSKTREFLLFVLMSIIGLALNALLMRIIVEVFSVHYMLAKILVTGLVMIYNFITRKIFLDDGRRL